MCKRFFRIAAILLLLSLLLFMTGCGKKQHVSFGYSFAISPKKGEVLKNVTVYLPFPTKNGKPMMEIYRSLERHYKNYHLDDTPNLALSIADTKYGPMLKVKVPELKQGVGLNGGYSQEGSLKKVSAYKDFYLNPSICTQKQLSDRFSYIFAGFKNAKELGLALEYKISILSPSLLPLDYVPEERYETYLGWEQPPVSRGSIVKYYNSVGWAKVPISDSGFDRE
ncbi:MAG: hypothetical protein ACYC56_10815 [Candidatus Aquicultor sp.]